MQLCKVSLVSSIPIGKKARQSTLNNYEIPSNKHALFLSYLQSRHPSLPFLATDTHHTYRLHLSCLISVLKLPELITSTKMHTAFYWGKMIPSYPFVQFLENRFLDQLCLHLECLAYLCCLLPVHGGGSPTVQANLPSQLQEELCQLDSSPPSSHINVHLLYSLPTVGSWWNADLCWYMPILPTLEALYIDDAERSFFLFDHGHVDSRINQFQVGEDDRVDLDDSK